VPLAFLVIKEDKARKDAATGKGFVSRNQRHRVLLVLGTKILGTILATSIASVPQLTCAWVPER